MTASGYLTLSKQAVTSAPVLLDADDTDGACNRAYYAMFNAANAALIASGDSPTPKSHVALLRLFSLKLIKTGALPDTLGRSLHNVQNLRHVADYQLSTVDPGGAESAIADAHNFIDAVQDYITRLVEDAPQKSL